MSKLNCLRSSLTSDRTSFEMTYDVFLSSIETPVTMTL